MSNEITTEASAVTSRLAIDVSQDRVQAFIGLPDPADATAWTADELIGALRQANIVVNETVTTRVNELLALIASGNDLPDRFLLAEGRPATEPKDAEFTWNPSLQEMAQGWQDDAPINYYKLNSILTIEADAILGELTPAIPGQDGIDIYGHPIKPTQHPLEIELGDGVTKSSEDPKVIKAVIAGRVQQTNNKLAITPVLDIKGDVDFESGSVDSCVDVDISGTVHDQFEVCSQKSVSIRGAVEAASVEAKSDISIRGGILGHHKGKVSAEGEIVARFCDEADLCAAGNITICKSIMNSRLYTNGKLLTPHGAVIGGEIYAREGAQVDVLGSEAGVPTSIAVGIHAEVLQEAKKNNAQINEKKKAVQKIRETVQPLMANLKRLTPDQKERATELLYKADELEAEVAEIEKSRDAMIAQARAKETPSVYVSKIIHEGASIRIGNRHTLFNEDLKGPVRIEKRKVNNITEFVSVNQLSGSITVLPSIRLDED